MGAKEESARLFGGISFLSECFLWWRRLMWLFFFWELLLVSEDFLWVKEVISEAFLGSGDWI